MRAGVTRFIVEELSPRFMGYLDRRITGRDTKSGLVD
jgi:hypothetical protein